MQAFQTCQQALPLKILVQGLAHTVPDKWGTLQGNKIPKLEDFRQSASVNGSLHVRHALCPANRVQGKVFFNVVGPVRGIRGVRTYEHM